MKRGDPEQLRSIRVNEDEFFSVYYKNILFTPCERIYVDDHLILDVEADAGFWSKGNYSGNNPWSSGTKMAPFDRDVSQC